MKRVWMAILVAVASALAMPGCGDGNEAQGSGATPTNLTCPPGFGDCDGDPSNGCEGALETSIMNCGECAVMCEAGAGETPLCSAGSCVRACDPGFGDCDASATNGCEADIVGDPKHCGGCGTTCKEGCLRGACDVTELAAGLAGPTFIEVDDTSVYWANTAGLTAGAGSIVKMPKGGGAVAVIAEGLSSPRVIAFDADHVYWANQGSPPMFTDGTLMRAPKGGGAPETIASGQNVPYGVAVIGSSVYWTTQTDVMRKVIGDPGAPAPAATGQARPLDIIAVGQTLYWTNIGTGFGVNPQKDGSIMAMVEGGSPVTLVSGVLAPLAITADAAGGFLYWCSEGAIMRLPIAGGAAEVVLDKLDPWPWRIAVDGASVFWVTASGPGSPLMSVSLSTKEAAVVAPNQVFLWDVAVDATRVYWTQNGDGETAKTGAVLRIDK
jgi:hypothetical protein